MYIYVFIYCFSYYILYRSPTRIFGRRRSRTLRRSQMAAAALRPRVPLCRLGAEQELALEIRVPGLGAAACAGAIFTARSRGTFPVVV